ncbi:hypothetical protein [Nocardia sp. NPDC002869]|uniref:hypothetical protein n=1 Tax=Nocardia sp. NPDC002869 TaxID=3161032 RepID=UPI00398D0453
MQSTGVMIVARDRLEAAARSIGLIGFRQTRGASGGVYNASDTFRNVERGVITMRINGRTRLVFTRPVGHRRPDPAKSTGRTRPGSREEAAFMSMTQENAEYGTELTSVTLRDSRWPATEGWVKMSMKDAERGFEIHYVYNRITRKSADFKFKDRTEPNR